MIIHKRFKIDLKGCNWRHYSESSGYFGVHDAEGADTPSLCKDLQAAQDNSGKADRSYGSLDRPGSESMSRVTDQKSTHDSCNQIRRRLAGMPSSH